MSENDNDFNNESIPINSECIGTGSSQSSDNRSLNLSSDMSLTNSSDSSIYSDPNNHYFLTGELMSEDISPENIVPKGPNLPISIRNLCFSDNVDPIEEINKYLSRFESQYGSRHPVFFHGTYNLAIDEAKRDLKFLLIYLHCEQHEDTQEFCRTIIINQRFIDFITENNLLFWSSSVTSGEGYRMSQQLREITYPFLALNVVKQNRMVVVRKFEGKTSIETLLTEIKLSIEDNESGLRAARLERQERNKNQMLRKQQDEAFAQSLRADQEKERKKLEEKNKKEADEMAKKEKQLEESQRREQLLNLRDALVQEIPAEPDTSDPNATKLVVKLPNGTRLERDFIKSQSIRYLYYFVFCNKESPLNFQIRTNFPPRDLPAKSPQFEDFAFNEDNTTVKYMNTGPEMPTFDECDLGKGAMLFVHDLEA